MANCISCGRPLPAFTFGDRGNVCADCRKAAVEVPANWSGSGTTAAPPAPRAIRARGQAPITTVLVGMNIAVFLAMALAGVSWSQPTTQQLLKWGANFGPLSLGTQPWRMLSSNYLHIGILHILFNMWCLWDLGNLAERIFDRWTYLLIYTVCGLAGSVASLWWHPLVVGAGASGAIFGLAGALIAALYLGKLPFPRAAVQHTMRSLLMFAGYNLFFGAVGAGVDNSAHLGGLASGLALGAVLAKQLTEPPEVRHRWRLAVFAVATIALGMSFQFVKHTRGYVVPLAQAVNALSKNNLDDAVHSLEETSARKPDDPAILVELGSAYLHQQNYAKAEQVLQHAVQLNPQSAEGLYELGFAQLRLGKTDDAMAALQKAVELDPQDPNKQEILGAAYLAKGMKAESQAAFQKANDLRQNDLRQEEKSPGK